MKTKHLTRSVLLISMAAFSSTAFAAEAVADKPTMEKKETVQSGSLTAMIADSTTFATLTKALKASELDVTLGTKGEYTVFAPTDEAFGKLPVGVLTKLFPAQSCASRRNTGENRHLQGRALCGRSGHLRS